MPLVKTNAGGDYTPYIKFNAQSGRFFAKFNGYEGDIEILNPRLAFDFATIKTGWIAFGSAGQFPQKQWDAVAGEEGPRPDWPKAKPGFCVQVVGRDPIPNAGNQTLGVRELMAVSNSLIIPINAMYDAYDADQEHAGEIPVYRCTGVVPVVGHHATNYQPQFQLTGWKPRSEMPELDGVEPSGDNGDTGQAEPPSQAQPEGEPYLEDDIPF